MSHLTNDEILNAVESGPVRPHLDSCAQCRARVDALRDVLLRTAEVPVPEPSPLFWNHFSERVREAIAADAVPARRPSWRVGFTWAASVAGVLAVIVIGAAVTFRTAQPANQAALNRPVQVQPIGSEEMLAPPAPLDEDATWSLMGDIAAQMDWDEAREAGLVMRPGTADQAVSQLSDDEQRQVIALIKSELQKTKTL